MYGFDPRHRHHVAADGISSAATFCKSHLSLILSRLLPNCDPLRRARSWFFIAAPCVFFARACFLHIIWPSAGAGVTGHAEDKAHRLSGLWAFPFD